MCLQARSFRLAETQLSPSFTELHLTDPDCGFEVCDGVFSCAHAQGRDQHRPAEWTSIPYAVWKLIFLFFEGGGGW